MTLVTHSDGTILEQATIENFPIMKQSNNLIQVLNDLIEINNARIEGYHRAANELKSGDIDLRALFRSMANDSKYYATELKHVVTELSGASSPDTINKGKVNQSWINVHPGFSRYDRQGILDSCEYGEAKAQEAYQNALTGQTTLSENIRSLVASQQLSLKTAHDLIKTFKDAAHAMEV